MPRAGLAYEKEEEQAFVQKCGLSYRVEDGIPIMLR